jgi:hypothetical protein
MRRASQILDLVAARLHSASRGIRDGATVVTFRIAVVQPICHRPGTDEANIENAVRTVACAAAE